MDSPASTPSSTPAGNNDASKTTRTAIIFIVVAIVLIVAIAFCAFRLHRVDDRLVQAEEKIEILTTTGDPIVNDDQVRLMAIEEAQKQYDAYINSQGNLLTIFGILITAMVALLGVGGPILLNREQFKANKDKIGEEVKKQEQRLNEETDTKIEETKKKIEETNNKIEDAKKQIDNQILDIGKAAETRAKEMDNEMKLAQSRIQKIERDVTGIIEDLRKRQENFGKNREIENKSPDEQVKEWKKMEEEGRADSDIFFSLGQYYFNTKDYISASHYYGEAVKNRENYAEVYPLWADALEAQGQLAKAWEKREKAILLNPNDQDLKNKQSLLLDCILAPASSLKETETLIVNGVECVLKLVRKGVFTMGATREQGDGADEDEKPVHNVLISSDYYIGETVVTQALWKAVMGDDNNPSRFKGDNRPVENVSWNDVTHKFIPELNRRTGRTFRLPTEAEWEFAARGGNKSKGYKYSGSDDIDEVAWYSNDETQPVKGKKANELGLCDMSGNVWEWCQDWFVSYSNAPQSNPSGPETGHSRVIRGGSCSYNAKSCRVASRGYYGPKYTHRTLGFRLALDASLSQEGEKKS